MKFSFFAPVAEASPAITPAAHATAPVGAVGLDDVGAMLRAAPPGVASAQDTPPCDDTGLLRPREAARIAIYDASGAAPRVEEVAPIETSEYIARLATRTYDLARALGGLVPYSVISEIVENYIHAGFRGPVVTILDSGNTIRFSDQGPGIKDKSRAMEPGYTTASAHMKPYIRGVGSGLPLARECLSFAHGSLDVQDNLGTGAVVTVSVARPPKTPEALAVGLVSPAEARYSGSAPTSSSRPGVSIVAAGSMESLPFETSTPPPCKGPTRLSNRQKRVLALVMDAGVAGPSLVARELAIGLSTAYRDLAHLEVLGFIDSDETGKRSITPSGADYLKGLLNASS